MWLKTCNFCTCPRSDPKVLTPQVSLTLSCWIVSFSLRRQQCYLVVLWAEILSGDPPPRHTGSLVLVTGLSQLLLEPETPPLLAKWFSGLKSFLGTLLLTTQEAWSWSLCSPSCSWSRGPHLCWPSISQVG